MVQLAGCQVTQISEGGKVDVALRGDKQVYAHLQAHNNKVTLCMLSSFCACSLCCVRM